MGLELLAGLAEGAKVRRRGGAPRLLVVDSGLGGLTVLAALRAMVPDADYCYAADDAAFPYGALDEARLTVRFAQFVERMVAEIDPDLVVVACHTASTTLALAMLRGRLAIPVVGTVPAVKPAVEISASRRVSVLATPGTIARDYTRELVKRYAGDCLVDLVPSRHLAPLAERALMGLDVEDAAIAAEIAPAFVDRDGRRTDVVVLACTHYPLLLDRLQQLAPWPVAFLDLAPAIARRVAALVGDDRPRAVASAPGRAFFTGGANLAAGLERRLAGFGLEGIAIIPLPLD